MKGSLVQYLGSQPMMQIIRGLLYSPGERHLRDLASQYSLSPSGVADILRRLKYAGVLKERRVNNRRCLELVLSASERSCLMAFFVEYEVSLIAARTERFSQRAADKLEWMDEAYVFYYQLKNDPT